MDKLQELYKRRNVFTQYNIPIPAELAEEISEAESNLFSGIAESILGYLPNEVSAPEGSRIVVASEYVNGILSRTAVDFNKSIESLFSTVKVLDQKTYDGEDDDTQEDGTRKKSIGFSVRFLDSNKNIRCNTAVYTMIEALRFMGLERSSQFTGESFMGYPVVGKKQRPGGRWQKYVDGWWIYTNMSNERKIDCLKGISKMLNMPMEVIPDEEMPSQSRAQEKPKGIRVKYSLNGSTPLAKNRSVWETVRRFLEEMPSATFAEVLYQFPPSLQGSYGVVRAMADIEQRKQRNKTEVNRWFLEPSEILTSADGVRFAVSTEWGDNFVDFQEHVKKELNWILEEV